MGFVNFLLINFRYLYFRLVFYILEIFLACCKKKLNIIDIDWLNKRSLCVVVCSNGYPDKFNQNVEINNIKQIIEDSKGIRNYFIERNEEFVANDNNEKYKLFNTTNHSIYNK